MNEFPTIEAGERVRESQWCIEDGWHVWRERTTKHFGHLRVEITRTLFRGLSAFSTTHEWRGQILYIQSIGCDGTVRVEKGYLTTRIRFDIWGPATFIPFLKSKILSEVAAATTEVAGSTFFGSKEVFIIHGHNEPARTQLKLMLQGLGLNPVVLSEQSDKGMTVIEKFEYYANACSFAFALMTPDDIVAGPDGANSIWRARPNVTLEIGWFMARLGRTRVVLLYQHHGQELEIPSDLQGVLYLPFKESVLEVAPELSFRMREAGLT
jgi:predicted nucleotide-binding protein